MTLFEDATARYLGNPLLNVTLSWPVLRSQRLQLTYLPATEMDAQALAHYQNDPNVTQLPLYLFRVKPVLKLENTVLAEGPAVTMGQPQEYTLTLTDPSQSYPHSGTVQAGDETVFTVNGNGLTLDVLKSRAAATRDTTDVAENLHQLGLLFWFEHDWLDSLAAPVYQVRVQRMPSVGAFFMPLTVRYLFGIPRSGYYHTRQIDVRRNAQMLVGETPQARFDFMSHIGIHGSYLEGSVLDQLFGQTWMPGRSTTQVLREAMQQNIPIYTVTSTNLQTVLPQLSLTADVREEIINAVSVGKTVVIPQRDVTQGRWVGTGYIIQDPVTGEGAYLIDGGYNGGTWEGCTITVQASVYRQGFIYGALSALQDWFEQLQTELTARLKAEMAVSKQLQENRTQVEQLNQLLDLSVKLFIGALTALGVEPLISGNACFVAKAKPATADTYVKTQVYVPLAVPKAIGNSETAMEFTADGVTSCWNYQWTFGEGPDTSTDQSPSYSYPGAGKYVVTVSATCQGHPATLTSQVTVYLIGLSLKKMWETQTQTNQIVDRTLKDDPSGVSQIDEQDGEATYGIYRHKLYSVSDAQNTYRVSVDIDVQPPELRHRVFCAAYQNGHKVNQSDTALPTAITQPAEMVFVDPSSEPAVSDFDIKIGFDANQNRLLDEEEAKALDVYTPQGGQSRSAIVKGINNAKYEEHRVTIDKKINITPDWLEFPAPNARAFLKIFYECGPEDLVNSPYQPTSSGDLTLEAFTNNVGFSEWLTHNAGLEFDAQGKATIQQYIWEWDTKVAKFFAERTPFALEDTLNNSQGYFELPTPTGKWLKEFYGTYVKTDAEQLLMDKEVGSTVTMPQGGEFYHFPNEQAPELFNSLSPAWVKPSTVAVGEDDGYGGLGALFGELVGGGDSFKEFDAFGVVGRGRVLDPRYRFTVTKEERGIWPLNTVVYSVSTVHFRCELEDLYDFNYESGVLPSHAAALQIGFGKGTNGNQRHYGKVYRHQIIIDHHYNYPFEHTQMPSPTLRKKETTKGE